MSDVDILRTGKGALPYRFEAPNPTAEDLSPLPRVVHMLWLDELLPAKYVALHDELRAHNPDWTVKLWSDSSKIPMKNRDLFEAERNPGARSDIARYEVIFNEGGSYLDIDFKSHGPGSLAERMTRPWVTVSGPPWYNSNNAHFGFGKGSSFLCYVMRQLRDPRVRAETDSTRRMGPTFWTTCLLSFNDMRFVCASASEVMAKLEHLHDANWVRWAQRNPD